MTFPSQRVCVAHAFRHYFIARIKLHLQKAACSTNPSTADDFLHRQRVQFATSEGENIDVEAVFQDTLPSGSQLGTVLAIHGAPGSHKDYKYVTPLLLRKGIRFIGVNMPEFGLTPGDSRLKCNNVERNNFVHEFIAKFGNLNGLVLMGHSRGSENAASVAAKNVSMLSGLVLVNPTGLDYHRAMRPLWLLKFLLWFYSLGSFARKIVHPCMKFFYNNVLGLRLDSGERAMMCVRTMHSLEYDKAMRPSISAINEKKDVRVLVAYAGKDPLIETKISRDLANSFREHKELICKDKSESAEEEVIKETRNLFSRGIRTVSVNFKRDGHFLQRDRARFIADSIEAMLKS